MFSFSVLNISFDILPVCKVPSEENIAGLMGVLSLREELPLSLLFQIFFHFWFLTLTLRNVLLKSCLHLMCTGTWEDVTHGCSHFFFIFWGKSVNHFLKPILYASLSPHVYISLIFSFWPLLWGSHGADPGYRCGVAQFTSAALTCCFT